MFKLFKLTNDLEPNLEDKLYTSQAAKLMKTTGEQHNMVKK